jgi:hypothetical protein
MNESEVAERTAERKVSYGAMDANGKVRDTPLPLPRDL